MMHSSPHFLLIIKQLTVLHTPLVLFFFTLYEREKCTLYFFLETKNGAHHLENPLLNLFFLIKINKNYAQLQCQAFILWIQRSFA